MAVETISLVLPLDGEDCQISVTLPALLDDITSPIKAARVLAQRLVSAHGIPVYLQDDLERLVLGHLDSLRQA